MSRVLVAGVGNVFFTDDGFGPETILALADRPWPPGVRLVDFGIRAVHLALELLEPWDRVIVLDAVARGGAPGTLYVIEPSIEAAAPFAGAGAHGLDLRDVFAQARGMGATLPPVTLVGCEPGHVGEGMGTSQVVRAAIPAAVALVAELLAGEAGPAAVRREEEGR